MAITDLFLVIRVIEDLELPICTHEWRVVRSMAFLREIRAKRQAKVDPDTQIKYTYCGHEITLQTDPEGGVAGLVWFAVGTYYH